MKVFQKKKNSWYEQNYPLGQMGPLLFSIKSTYATLSGWGYIVALDIVNI